MGKKDTLRVNKEAALVSVPPNKSGNENFACGNMAGDLAGAREAAKGWLEERCN